MKRLILYLNFWRFIIPIIPYLIDSQFRILCIADLERIKYAIPQYDTMYGLCYALLYNMPYRAVYQYRLNDYKIIKYLSRLFLSNKREIEISGDIMPGFAIFHGQGCVIHCKKAGKNLSVWQNVTIGRNPSKQDDSGIDIPSLGDNVNIYTGSIIAGGITIGNNVDIGAGSVVLNDIPDDCVAVGNPAKVIRYKKKGGDDRGNLNKKTS